MSEERVTPPIAVTSRLRRAVLAPANRRQLARYAVVGIVGYVVSLVAFAFLVHVVHASAVVAATAAFVCALISNFAFNRHWTFGAHEGHLGAQALRFAVVNIAAFLFSLVVLKLLIAAGLDAVAAEAIAVLTAAPPAYLANRLWSFRL